MRRIALLLLPLCTVSAFAQDSTVAGAPVPAASGDGAFGLPLNSRLRLRLSKDEVRRFNSTHPRRERFEKRQFESYLVGVRGDSVALRWRGVTRVVPIAEVERVHVSRKRTRAERVRGGALVGAGMGVILGVTFQCHDDVMVCVPYSAALPAGVATGVLFGAITPGRRWEEVRPPRATLGLRPTARGATVTVALSFR